MYFLLLYHREYYCVIQRYIMLYIYRFTHKNNRQFPFQVPVVCKLINGDFISIKNKLLTFLKIVKSFETVNVSH